MAGEEPGGTPPRHLLEHEEPLKGNAQLILSVSLPLSLSLSHGLKAPLDFFFLFFLFYHY